MCAYRMDLEGEIKAANIQIDELINNISTPEEIKSSDFLKKWSEIQSLRQSVQAKQQRLNGVRGQSYFPEPISLEQYKNIK